MKTYGNQLTKVPFILGFIVLLFYTVFKVNAETPDSGGAKKVAEAYFRQNAAQFASGETVRTLSISNVYVSGRQVGTPVFVYQKQNNGFVIIGQNNNNFAVLGYSPSGQFDIKTIPPQLMSLLKSYEDSVRISNHSLVSKATPVMTPLLDEAGVKLNQFNHEEVGYCPTGCVATAFTQIMSYYKFPEKGSGSHCYNEPEYGQLCADFANTIYNWDNPTEHDYMKLSFHVGIAIDMNYCRDQYGSAPAAYGFEKSIQKYFKYYFNYGCNESFFICNELDNKRPVYIELPGTPGHAMVLDGYDTDGLFHINFGWGGLFNGYYALNTSERIYTEYEFGTNIFNPLFMTPYPLKTNLQDSLSLVAIHNGLNETTGWDLTQPVSTWNGVLVMNERVIRLTLNNSQYTKYKGVISSEIGNLSALQRIDLLGQFDGELPATIAHLTALRELFIYPGAGTFQATLPPDIGNLTELENITIPQRMSGIIPASFGNLTKLRIVNFGRGELSGKIPEEIGNLKQLEVLNLFDHHLTGSLPDSFGQLTNLKELYLSENQLSGSIPASIGNLTQLTTLSLNNNQLTGNIPASVGNLTKLNILKLNNNLLSGSVPTEIGNCTQIVSLGLSDNQLEGNIPAGIGNLTGLLSLDLGRNRFTSLPQEAGNLKKLKELYLQSNRLATLPDSLAELHDLRTLDASNNQITVLPENFGNWDNIRSINLRNNLISTFPEQICFAPFLQSVDLGKNKIEKLPVSVGLISSKIEFFAIDSNLVRGRIPDILMNNPNLISFLRYNRFIFENIPVPNPKLYNSVGNQRPVSLTKRIFKVAMRDTITLDIRQLAPFTSEGNTYFWYAVDKNKNVTDSSEAVLQIVIDENTIHQKFYCNISNPTSPKYSYINGSFEMQLSCLNNLTTDTISFLAASDEEVISEKYDGGYVISSKNLPLKTVGDELVTLVPPLHLRGNIIWQASADGISWYDLSTGMPQVDLKSNLLSIRQNELVLSPKTSAYYRCSVQDVNCEPLFSDTIRVNPFGKIIYNDSISVVSEKRTIAVDSLEVTLPKGIYDKNFRITITKSDNLLSPVDSFRLMTPYDITVSFAETFDIPLVIKLKNLDKKSFDNRNIHNYKAYYLDEKTHEWIAFEKSYISMLDTSMVIESNHLTKVAIGWWDKKFGYNGIYERNDIRVYYKTDEEAFMRTTYAKKQSAQPWHVAGVPLLVQDITEYLSEVRNKFQAVGIPVPATFNVYIKQMDDADGVVGISGMINDYLTINTLTESPKALRSLLAHEYMHYSQSKFMSPDPGNIFWMEANGHLSDRLVWDKTVIPISESEDYLLNGRKSENSIYNFLSNSWDYWDTGFATQNAFGNINYCYLAGTFLHYMRSYSEADNKLDPVSLLKETTSWSGDNWRTYLSNYIAFSMNSLIGDEYDNYVRYILSGENPNFTILNTAGNPFSELIMQSGMENDGVFSKRINYAFDPVNATPQKDKVDVTVPYLASKVYLLHNSTVDKAVFVSLKRLDDASGHQNKIYFGQYNFKLKKMEFTDISDSTKFNFLIEARNPEMAEENKNIRMLLIINKNNPQGNTEKDFEASFELTAIPIIDIEYLTSGYIAGSNGANLGVHKDIEGRITNFVLYSYANSQNASVSSYREILNDSSYAVTTTYNKTDESDFEKYHHTSVTSGTMHIIYNFYAGTLIITNKNNYTTRVSTPEKANMLNLVSNGEQELHVRNFTNYNLANNESWFKTNNSTETQEAVEFMSQKYRSTYYDWDTGEVLTVVNNQIVSTMYEQGDIILFLKFKTR